MKATLNKNFNWVNFKNRTLVVVALALLVAGCGKDSDDGTVVNSIQLPLDDGTPLALRCENVGVKDERCILDDPNNPYARVIVSEGTKFDLDADAQTDKAKFYLWATALANSAGAPGENQFYVAYYLQRIWAANQSIESTRLQALKAYRSYLDNYFGSVTFFEIPVGSGNFFPQSLNSFSGQLIYDPRATTNTFNSSPLFSADAAANMDLADKEIGAWGYFYDRTTGVFTKNF